MNDYEYVFKQDSKEKKNIGNSARKMNRTGKGPIKFPSDYLTASQKKKLNGPCATYDMGKPMSYKDFCALPEDIQRLYLQGIIDKFHPDNAHIADLFGINKSTVSYRMGKLGVRPTIDKVTKKASGIFDEKAWDAWIADGIIPETKEPVIDIPEEDKIEVVDAYLSKLSFGEADKKMETIEEVMPLVKIPENIVADIEPIEEPKPKWTGAVRELGKANEIKYLADKSKPNLEMIAAMWGAYLKTRSGDLTAKDIAVMMSISKLVEIIYSDFTDDDWKQLSAYAMLAGSRG